MSERERFEAWLLSVHWLTGTWNQERNCYEEFPCHLAWKAWQERASLDKGVNSG